MSGLQQRAAAAGRRVMATGIDVAFQRIEQGAYDPATGAVAPPQPLQAMTRAVPQGWRVRPNGDGTTTRLRRFLLPAQIDMGEGLEPLEPRQGDRVVLLGKAWTLDSIEPIVVGGDAALVRAYARDGR